MVNDISSHDAFWQFSCHLYQQEGVKELCLHCQDELGLNVNLLLLCAWLTYFEVSLTTSQWQRLQQAIQSSDAELQELRKNRNSQIKGSEQYKTCLRQELQFEAQQQALIVQTINGFVLRENNELPIDTFFAAMACLETSTRDALVSVFSKALKEYPFDP